MLLSLLLVALGFLNVVAEIKLNNARSLLAIIVGEVFRCFPCRSMGPPGGSPAWRRLGDSIMGGTLGLNLKWSQ